MRCDRKTMRLYAVTDRAWVGQGTLGDQVEQALRGGVTCVQLREKSLGPVAIQSLFCFLVLFLFCLQRLPDRCKYRLKIFILAE